MERDYAFGSTGREANKAYDENEYFNQLITCRNGGNEFKIALP